MAFYQWQQHDLLINVRVQPKAANDALAEILQHETSAELIKIRITAPPVDGKANKHLIGFLSQCFKVPKSDITLLSGETGRNKKLLIKSPKSLPDGIEPCPA